MPDNIFLWLKLEDEFIVIMCKVNPYFIKYVQQDGEKKFPHLRLLKSLYGFIEFAFLWFNLYKDTMKAEGSELNPYEKGTANKMMNGKNYTIQWSVDNKKVTYIRKYLITKVVNITRK